LSLNRSKFLEPKELLSLKSSLGLDSRDSVLITLAVETGARAGEILSLKQSDLFSDTNTVFFRTSKGGKDREIPVRPELMVALQKYVPFNIKYRRFHQIWQKYKPAKKKLHSLRHTFAVNLYVRTKDLKLTQLALGHSSPVTTSIYTDFVYSREEMKRILG
jgi:integrase